VDDTLRETTTGLSGAADGYQRMETEETSASTFLYDSFAESYNYLVTSSLNDHSYTPEFAQQFGGTRHQRNEEVYSLTNLQTKYERMQGESKFLLFFLQKKIKVSSINFVWDLKSHSSHQVIKIIFFLFHLLQLLPPHYLPTINFHHQSLEHQPPQRQQPP
jgi:hypothetical protein